MTSYRLCWIDERLSDLEGEEQETIKHWKNQDKNIYFEGDDVILNIEANDNIEAQIKALKKVEEFDLDVWSLIKTEIILTEEVELE